MYKMCYNETNLSARRDMFATKVRSYAKLNLSLNVIDGLELRLGLQDD